MPFEQAFYSIFIHFMLYLQIPAARKRSIGENLTTVTNFLRLPAVDIVKQIAAQSGHLQGVLPRKAEGTAAKSKRNNGIFLHKLRCKGIPALTCGVGGLIQGEQLLRRSHTVAVMLPAGEQMAQIHVVPQQQLAQIPGQKSSPHSICRPA